MALWVSYILATQGIAFWARVYTEAGRAEKSAARAGVGTPASLSRKHIAEIDLRIKRPPKKGPVVRAFDRSCTRSMDRGVECSEPEHDSDR
jgi:hypothetical protein